jgi:hypothetical protein
MTTTIPQMQLQRHLNKKGSKQSLTAAMAAWWRSDRRRDSDYAASTR